MSVAKKKAVNQALAHLGEPGYPSIELDPPPPKLAKVLEHYDDALGWTLRRHPWLCAMSYATLDPRAAGGNWKFPYVFDLPQTAARIWEVRGACSYETGSEVDGGASRLVLRADAAGPLNVAFTEAKPLDAMTQDFLDAFAYELASRSAGPVQEDYAKGDRLRQRAIEAVALGSGAEAGEHGGEDPLAPSGFAALRRSAG